MNRMPRVFLHVLRLFALAAAMATAGLAWADDYSDVTLLIRSGQATEALARADRYLAAKPRDPQMRFLKGVAQTDAGRTAEAIATFMALNQDYPELPEPYNNLAVLYAAQGQFEKARAALETAIRANPNYAVAQENLGDVYARLAGLSYAKAQQLDPANTTAPAKLALIRQMLPPADKGRPVPAAAAASAAKPVAPRS